MKEIVPNLFGFAGSFVGLETYAYVLGGAHPLLVDTLMKGGPKKYILNHLSLRNIALDQVFLTHAHADHFGGLSEVVEDHPEITIYIHPDDACWIENTGAYLDGLYRDYGREAGFVYDERRIDWVTRLIGGPVPIRETAGEGQVFSTGNFKLMCIHLPGHTPGHTGLLDVEQQFLIAGDAIQGAGYRKDGMLAWPPVYTDLPSYRKTLEKLRSLEITMLFSGHFPVFYEEEISQFLDESLAFVAECEEVVCSVLAQADGGLSYVDLVDKVNTALGPYLNASVAAFPCILAHLKVLTQQGKVSYGMEQHDHRWYWCS